VPESSITFKYLGVTKREDGLVGEYHLAVTEAQTERTVTLSFEPRHLASARSMKRILLDQCLLYEATRAEHDQMLLEMLDPDALTIAERMDAD
jgi:hypothetical protein